MQRGAIRRPFQHDDSLHQVSTPAHGIVDDRLEANLLALAIGDVRREHEPGATRDDAAAERVGPEAGEDDGVDRANPDRGEHQRDRFRRCRHVDRQAIAAADSERAQTRGDALDERQERGVAEGPAFAALVHVDERGMAAAAVRDVSIEGVVREVRLGADEPAKRGEGPLEDAVPRTKPGQFTRGARPERFRVPEPALDPFLHDGRHDTHIRLPRSGTNDNAGDTRLK